MSLFVQSEGDSAVVVENGVFKQCDLYTRDGYLYAKVGGGFVRLNVDGSTSKAKLRLDFLDTVKPIARDRVGRLCSASMTDAVPLETKQKQLLIGSDK